MIIINTDCSIEPMNPGGRLAWAFIAKSNMGEELHRECGLDIKGERATNNRGEYVAVLAALRWLMNLPAEDRAPAIIQSDSQLIVNQMSGRWQVREEQLQSLNRLCKLAITKYGSAVKFLWVKREDNEEVDALSRTAYDQDELFEMRQTSLDNVWGDDDIPF